MTEDATYTLHRYFLWSNRLRLVAQESLHDYPEPPQDPVERRHWLIAPFAYLSYWFASLYVLIEGWKELGHTDEKLDALLASPYVDQLRRYRNGVFHFQADYFDDRLANFLDEGAHKGEWIQAVHDAFSRWFLDWFQGRGVTVRILDDETLEIEVPNVASDEHGGTA